MANFTLPDHHHPPPASPQLARRNRIATYIGRKFFAPEPDTAFRLVCELAVAMPMPEAPVHEYHYVGPAWQIPAMETEAIAEPV